MNISHYYKIIFSAILLLSGMSSQTWAVPIAWSLSDVRFNDGGTATGFIELDLAVVPDYTQPNYTIPSYAAPILGIAAILDFNIDISGGNESIFPAVTYAPDSIERALYGLIDRPENPPTFFNFLLAGLTPYDRLRSLRISPMFTLDGAINHVPLFVPNLTTSGLGAEECYSCSPYRKIIAGAFVREPPAPIPEPSTLLLFTLGLIGVIFARCRIKTS